MAVNQPGGNTGPTGYPTSPGSNPAGGAVTGPTFGGVSYPTIAQVETAANAIQLDYRTAIAFAAANGFTAGTTAIGLAFYNSFLGIFQGWQTSGQVDPSVTLDTLFAYVNFNGAWPTNPSALISWAQGAGFLNSQGKQYHTPSLGYGYPPFSSTWSTPSNTTAAAAPSTNQFDVGGFLAALTANPMTAISNYPVLAGGLAYVLFKTKPWTLLRR